jgi:hypothetical protein
MKSFLGAPNITRDLLSQLVTVPRRRARTLASCFFVAAKM